MNNLDLWEQKPLSDYLENGGDEKCLYFHENPLDDVASDGAIALRAKITSIVYQFRL